MKSTLAITAIIFTVGFVSLPVVFSDNDFRWGELEEYKHKSTGVANISNPVYKEECGSCHMAYPPGLLPASSWTKMMSGLEDHFGDNAELDADTHKAISEYLLTNSADKSDYRRSSKFNRSIKAEDAPLRISELPYFKHEHDEIPDRMVKGNTKVTSFSHCNACHTKAEQGSFNEHDIRIPGYGRWDD
ncbi:MAG: diheme cytochrome c [Gammaproteobacteria bacterium]|nr:diheme cytochrome c [Gammaproteobacteria bacterium]